MLSTDNTPTLVLSNIFQWLASGYDDIKRIQHLLPCLAVCSKWRYFAIPLAYREIVVKADYNSNLKKEEIHAANMDLFASSFTYRRHVKKVIVYAHNRDFSQILGSLLEILNMNKLEWPSEYKLDNTIRDPYTRFNSQELDDDLESKMFNVIDLFSQRFPNVVYLNLWITCPCGVVKQFVSKLIHVFADKLQRLDCNVKAPLNLDKFPSGLDKLKYVCNIHTYQNMPCIDPLLLQKLELFNVSSDFSWSQIFQTGSILFPRLTNLTITCDNTGTTSLMPPKASYKKLQFPKLRSLHIHKGSVNNHLAFIPTTISEKLNRVVLKTSPQDMYNFAKLPIKHIGALFAIVFAGREEVEEVVRNNINKFVAKSEKSNLIYM